VDAKDLPFLKEGMKCYLEPSIEMGSDRPELIKAHRGPITGVAVCADGKHFVSGSEDRTVCVWERGLHIPTRVLLHPSAVRVVACSPPGSPQDWLAVGCADGSIYLWDLANPKDPKVLSEKHRGTVSALAFSPKGTYFASGGEDNNILLWETAEAKAVYPFDAEHGVDDGHHGTVTALHFTPQARLVSAGRDNTLRVWALYKTGVKMEREIARRGGTVNDLGVSADGRYMLFDQGKTLQLLNVADGATACVLDNFAGANTFETLALFSPDGSLMLTGGADEGHLHLWKTPGPEERAFQVRDLVTKDRAQVTCASFAPGAANFAVSGSKDGYVHVWQLPNQEAVKNHRILVDAHGAPFQLNIPDPSLDGNKSRITINVLNPQERLLPGQRVTVVVVTD
jgi:WD40 repeat protein